MTTQVQPLKASPLRILRHQFTEIHLSAREGGSDDELVSLDFSREWGHAEDDDRKWRLLLNLKFGDIREGENPIYEGSISIEGFFEIAPEYPKDAVSDLVAVTGASILYGACREMLANITARSSQGMLSIPSVSFVSKGPSKKARKSDSSPL